MESWMDSSCKHIWEETNYFQYYKCKKCNLILTLSQVSFLESVKEKSKMLENKFCKQCGGEIDIHVITTEKIFRVIINIAG